MQTTPLDSTPHSIWTEASLGVPTLATATFDQPTVTSLWQIPGWVGPLLPSLAHPSDYVPVRSRLSRSLDEAFAAFNDQDTPEYAAEINLGRLHSMSPGDVLCTPYGSFLCLPCGWARLGGDWEPDLRPMEHEPCLVPDWSVPIQPAQMLRHLIGGGMSPEDAIYQLRRAAPSPEANPRRHQLSAESMATLVAHSRAHQPGEADSQPET